MWHQALDRPIQGVGIPPDFVPVSASRCVFTDEATPDDGLWHVRVEQQSTGDLTALVAALQERNRYQANANCPAIGVPVYVITLVNDAGVRVTPTVPTSGCGEVLPSVRVAIQQTSWVEVSRTRLREISAVVYEPANRCPGILKPVVALAAAERGPPASASRRHPSGRVPSRKWHGGL